MKKDEYMEWDKNLIRDINLKQGRYSDDISFDEDDSSNPLKFYFKSKRDTYIWNDYSFYAYKRVLDNNYIKLRTLKEKEKKYCDKNMWKRFLW